jgi:membrane fusion protein (multidrug efflux system)
VRLHDYVLKDKQVVELLDPSVMEVVVNVPAETAAGLKKGGTLRFAVDALGGKTFEGEIVAVIPQLDPKSRTLRVRAKLPNKDGKLLDGMYAVARIPAGVARDSVAVPTAALRGSDGDFYVWRVSDGRVQKRKVAPGAREGDTVEVSGDLKAGDSVVVAGADTLKPDAPVTVVTGK